MLAALLLQAAAFLPPEVAPQPAPAGYRARAEAILPLPEWSLRDLAQLQPRTDGERAFLVSLLQEGGPREVLLAAMVAAGAEPSDALTRACLRAACEIREEDAALAALLAPRWPDPACLPALAYLALEPDRPISVRAAAIGRLLDADCASAWPLARSLLRTGTPLDEDAPWADWPRGGRYELPKRVLLLSVNAWLQRHGQPPTDYEPNASWSDQMERLQALEAPAHACVAQLAAASISPRRNSETGEVVPFRGAHADPGFVACCQLLVDAAAAGDERALLSLAVLMPYAAAANLGDDVSRRMLTPE
ncbi:MAG: hypothetical protein EYC70_04575 [Planctomycetota bacterium]|nr:MAG: hypothetical protein EYC70_04575 [Planctomycetota bacterium]